MLYLMRIRPLTKDDNVFLRIALYHAIYVPPGEEKPDPDIVKHPDLARFARLPRTRSGDFIAKSTIAGSCVTI
jgi:hypothetical protein